MLYAEKYLTQYHVFINSNCKSTKILFKNPKLNSNQFMVLIHYIY